MRRHHWAILLAIVIALVVWLARSKKTSEPSHAGQAPPVRSEEAEHSALRKVRRHTEDKTRRDELAARISEAQAQSQSPSQSGTRPATTPQLDAEYIQGRIRDLLPLLKECYDLALREQPDLAGRLVLHFDIVADPALGGVVESTEIERVDGGANHAALEECVRATVETQTFAPVGKGGRVSVTYPFVFGK
jgi:hypothetical protein